MSIKVLVVDDEPLVVKSLARLLNSLECDISTSTSPTEAMQLCTDNNFDLVISDLRMPLISGSQLLSQIRDNSPSVTTILMSAYTDFNNVIACFNEGVLDYFIPKPWDEEDLLRIATDTIAIKVQENLGPSDNDVSQLTNFNGLLSSSLIMLKTFETLKKAAAANMPVYISGETGTGKEMAAKAIHIGSKRATEPFISFNCATFTASLMESQVFGHKKGSFTGALADQKGLLAAVGSGTLFLDEVISMDIDLQAKLLRVLQEREFSMVGSYKVQPFRGQIISASSESLKAAVQRGAIREDLRYRLEVIPVHLPPLRERIKDILPLFNIFVNQSSGGKVFSLSKGMEDHLKSYLWPGNIRELKNAASYAVAMTESDEMTIADLPFDIRSFESSNVSKSNPDVAVVIEKSPAGLTEQNVRDSLSYTSGNKTLAAKRLCISRTTLWRLLKKYGIE
jgi:DNA-binding NtrC family response regulator